jgi:hypothetical protein
MNKKIILLSVLTVSIASAGYVATFRLDPKYINIDTPDEITGVIELAPATINRGESTALNWNYNYIKSLKVVSSDESFNETAYFGSYPLSPLKTTNYDITLDNNKKIEEKTLKLTVIQPTPVVSFTVDKTKIGEGQSSKLTWNVSDAESALLENAGISGLNSSYTVSPVNDTTYKLNVTGYNNENNTSKSISIDVVKDSAIGSFQSDKTKVSIGDDITFNWTTNDSEGLELIPFGTVDKTSTSKAVTMGTVGDFTYSLKTTSFSGMTKTSNPIDVSVYGLPTITSYKVNNSDTSVTVEANDPLAFTWTGANNISYDINGVAVSNGTYTVNADASTGTKNYVLTGVNGAGKTINKSVSVNVVGAGNIPSFSTVPTTFANTPIVLNWTGTNINNYKLSGVAGSGISGSQDVGTALTYTTTPTSVGSLEYTLTGTNAASKTTVKKTSVMVEADPTMAGMTVNGQSSITVSPNQALSFVGTGLSSGATLGGKTSGGVTSSLPSNAAASAGVSTYYGAGTKTINGVTRDSALRSVTVSVINAPTIGAISIPTVINYGSGFTLSWSGTDVANYTVKGNVAASGVAVGGVSTGVGAALGVTPQAAGTYNYTVTATNAAGVSTNRTSGNVKVEQWVAIAPTYGDWYNTSGFYSCTAFSPDVSERDVGTGFYQTQYCYLNQARTRQDRIQEVATGEVRNTTSAAEPRTLSGQPNTQYAIGTKPTIVCRYDSGNQWQTIVVGGAQSLVNVVWNGGTKATSSQYPGAGAMNVTQITGWDGKSYTRGPNVTGGFWQVCSTP